MNVKGKVAVITGAGSGIGRAIAFSLAKRGCHLALVDCNEPGLNETVELITDAGVGISLHVLDVCNKEAVTALPLQIIQVHKTIDLLVNNAGIAAVGTFLEMSEVTFDRVIDVNFTAVVRLTRTFLPFLLDRSEAQIVNISSVFGLISPIEQTAYSASKFAVRGFTNALRHELENTPVKLMVVHPGGVATSIAKNALLLDTTIDGTTNDRLSRSDKYLRMPPAKAGEIIVRGIIKGKARLLVGADAKFLSLLERLLPVSYWNIMKKFVKPEER